MVSRCLAGLLNFAMPRMSGSHRYFEQLSLGTAQASQSFSFVRPQAIEEVTRSGVGERWEERATDFSEGLARNRYRVFKEQTYDALVSLKQIFHYHFINAQAPIPWLRRIFKPPN